MKRLFDCTRRLAPKLCSGQLALFLDFDGTLASIAVRPTQARLTFNRRRVLRRLQSAAGIYTALISGRSLPDLKRKVGLAGLIYAGNHAFEISGPRIHFVHPGVLRHRPLLRRKAAQLAEKFGSWKGVQIEDKGLSLSIHYRRVTPARQASVKKYLLKLAGDELRRGRLRLTAGKKVWELRPAVRWDKGRGILWLRRRLAALYGRRMLPVYLGDDHTDEDAFRAIRRLGIGIRVRGESRLTSAAGYYVKSTADVYRFLNWLMEIRNDQNSLV